MAHDVMTPIKYHTAHAVRQCWQPGLGYLKASWGKGVERESTFFVPGIQRREYPVDIETTSHLRRVLDIDSLWSFNR